MRCATCVITRGVSYIRVFRWAFGDASIKTWIYRHATFSFSRRRGGVWRKAWNGKQLEQLMRTTFRGVRANSPARSVNAERKGGVSVLVSGLNLTTDCRGRAALTLLKFERSRFYSCSGCCQ